MSRVWLHVYDLDEAPSGLAAIGLGAYHSAVQIGDREYAYGACDHGTGARGTPGRLRKFLLDPSSVGVWAGTPKQAEGFKYKKSVDLGVCRLSEVETNRVLGLMHQNWAGDEYDLLTHNCNHFSAALAKALVQPSSLGAC